jgi:hypothetical protein
VKGDVSALIVNNFIYNPGKYAIHFTDRKGSGTSEASIAGNVIVFGKDSRKKLRAVRLSKRMKSRVLIYLSDNKVFSRDGTSRSFTNVNSEFATIASKPPVWLNRLTVLKSSDVQKWILSSAGARPMGRDAVDSRLLRDIRNRGGRIIDSQREVEGFIDIDPVARKLTIPENPHADNDGDGYTNLEEWLHSMSEKVE